MFDYMNTTISIDVRTRDKLKEFGSKKQTYNDILNELMEVATLHGFLERQKWILRNEGFTPADEL